LNIVNFGISPYLFGVLAVLLVIYVTRVKAVAFHRDVLWFLGAWLVPPLLFFSFQVLKEIRHLLPALPAIGIAGAVLLVSALQGLRRPLRSALLLFLCAYPAYQFIASSFDTPYAPRKDLRLGPFILLIRDLELASLQLIPTYTFPANPIAWPTREVVSAIASHTSHAHLPAVRVVGEHLYMSGLVLTYQSVLSGTPITSHGPFRRQDPALSDFSVVVCGPEKRYGPLDLREAQVAASIADPRNGFQEIARVRLPSQCDALIYKNDRLGR